MKCPYCKTQLNAIDILDAFAVEEDREYFCQVCLRYVKPISETSSIEEVRMSIKTLLATVAVIALFVVLVLLSMLFEGARW